MDKYCLTQTITYSATCSPFANIMKVGRAFHCSACHSMLLPQMDEQRHYLH